MRSVPRATTFQGEFAKQVATVTIHLGGFSEAAFGRPPNRMHPVSARCRCVTGYRQHDSDRFRAVVTDLVSNSLGQPAWAPSRIT